MDLPVTTRQPPRASGAFTRVEVPPAPPSAGPAPTSAGAIHDLRNLLYVITACSESAVQEVKPGTDAYENLADIRAAAARATKLVEALAGDRLLGTGAVDVNAVVADFVPILRRQAGSRAQVELEVTGGELLARIDTHSLEHVLLNLIVNAVDAIEQSGRVTVRTARVEGVVRITVADTGCGMTPATLARAFDVRFTTRAALGRRGMGLATVRRLVEAVGGRVSATSTVGVGTEIVIELSVALH